MGTAGLNVKRLAGLLEQQKVDLVLIEGDESQDHAVMELTSVRRPNLAARLEYENKGFEPRLVLLKISPANDPNEEDQSPLTIQISGKKDDDLEKIVQFVRENFLNVTSRSQTRARD